MKIRDMKVEDLPVVFKIGAEEFDMTRIYHQYWNLMELISHFEKDKELCVVAELDGRVIGFALGHKKFSMWENDLGYFEWLAVSKEHQRKGIGSALCEEMLKRFHKMGVKRILADVKAKENGSKKLLEKFSFKKLFSVDWFIKEASKRDG
jgi:ribosomal protein S18 acetylase RimI-like enzyme